jgi:hypothetical protein
MAINLSTLGGSKTRYQLTLSSGTSYTVPAGVTYLNVTLVGAGGGAGSTGGGGGGAGGSTTFTGATSASGGGGGANTSSGDSPTPVRYGDGGERGTVNTGSGMAGIGSAGQIVSSIVTTTPGASISYSIGSGGSSGSSAGYGHGGPGANGCIIIEYWA